MTDDAMTISDEEGALAASQEETERLAAENRYLKQRVVLLRSAVNRLTPKESPTENEEGIDSVD